MTPNSAGCADRQDSNAVDSCGLIRRARPQGRGGLRVEVYTL